MEMFDTETFIADVEARPAIWDSRTEEYSDKERRSKAWNELCMKFVPNFAEKSIHEKNNAAIQIQRRWKSFRDCFKRELTKQTKALRADTFPTRKPYKYYQNLSFLLKVTESGKAYPCPAVQEEKEFSDFHSATRKRKRISPNNDHEREPLQGFSETVVMSRTEVEEADRNFALSLLPHFKQIPFECKLDAQVEVLMVLKKYKPFGRQHFEYFSDTAVEQHSTVFQPKLSPASTGDGEAMSDDSSIHENLYYLETASTQLKD